MKLPLVCLLAIEAAAVTMLPVYWTRMRQTEAILTASDVRLEKALNEEVHRSTDRIMRRLSPDHSVTPLEPNVLAERQTSESVAEQLSEEEIARQLGVQADSSIELTEYPAGSEQWFDALEAFQQSITVRPIWRPTITRVAKTVAIWQRGVDMRTVRSQAQPMDTRPVAVQADAGAALALAATTIEIRNAETNGQAVLFLWGREVEQLDAGQSKRWSGSPAWVRFDSGLPNRQPETVQVTPGVYTFVLSPDSGWQLRREP